ncbi:MAG: hypothetical protein IPH08_00435 [Rhodocyclaceae bacterium]|nr:hypothetical protein [Rhodocyclaceae bacterium]
MGAWVDVDEFARYLRATGQDFAVAHDPWKLYIGDRQYGALGYDGFYDWNILQLRYLLAYLFEVAAPLGVVDVAYLPPEGAREDFRSLWGADDYPFLSRYDGLCHFRLTALGAHCLGLSADYAPPKATSNLRLSVSPSLTVKRTGGEPSAEDKLVLDTWLLALGDDAWSLDEAKAIAAVEQGLDPVALRDFLSERDDQPLPERVDAFVQRAQRQGRALSVIGPALLIQCADATIAERLATDKAAGKLCQRVGETQLAVRQEHEEKFRAVVRGMGVGLAG